ncbi:MULTISPECIES: mechanosensitive ion channel family protein [unclassified Parabacteroides]|uniref:mechanosensitive ion channel family protein n=1 Tax=unclassified Parabacteroides TaxID=2649774 RepID=UPI002474606C|nr:MULTISPECIES: mechanosensitive ion channel family protein [unclassified Parabacteroides]
MLEKEIWGNTLEHWGISILIVLGAYILMKLMAFIARKVFKPLTEKTQNKIDDVIYDSVVPPLLFGIMLLGLWIAIHHLVTPEKLQNVIDHSYRILVTLNVTWLFARFVNGLIDVYWVGDSYDAQRHRMLPIVKRTLLVLVWIVGLVMALSNIGVNISALLGTLGIGGIAFALAAQDTVKNVFGAFTILADKPFTIGDVVRIDSYEGTVTDIGVRSTKIRDYDGRTITLPNYKVADASVINISSEEPFRRVVMKLGLTYDTTPEKMQEAMSILKGIPSKIEGVRNENQVVFFSEFGDSAMVLTFIYFIKKSAGIQKVTSDVNMEILSSFNKAGLSFAFPSQTLYIDKSDAEQLIK